jgi:hypothetical protein
MIPHSVAISVGKTKKPFADGFTDGICAPKKKIPASNLPTDFYSVGDIVIYRRLLTVGKSVSECMKYRPNISVYEFVGKCGSNADGLSPSVMLSVSVYNTDRIYPSLKALVNATVRCRRINSVGKTLGNSFSKFVF